ncbi:MAG TPA: hypothetical protein VLG37_05450 [Candidatus Saccharimonadales bacterium]|nr:hypothetical protein [Candidatus Saccharimonadales bacterium]
MLNFLVELLLTYLFVQGWIIAFMLPFYLWYRYRHQEDNDPNHSFSNRLEKFFLSKQANYLVFFWALGEALVWFVIPEFLLLLVVFMRIRRKKELLVYDVAGTVTGTVLAFIVSVPDRFIYSLPYIQERMISLTHSWYDRLGVWGLLYQPFSGVPYKVFTLMAHQYHFFLPYFIVVAVLVRMSRYFVAYGLFAAIYPGLHRRVRSNYVWLFLIATFIFSALLLKVYNSFA